MFKYLLFKIGHFLVNLLPLSVSKFITGLLCECHYWLSVSDRRDVQKNLRIICGERPDIPRMSKEVFYNFGLYLIEFLRLSKMLKDDFIAKHVVIENMDHVKRIVDAGQGAIVLTAHIGNWEYGGAILGKFGYPLTIIALSHHEQPVNNFFNNQRMKAGNRVVQTDDAIRVCTQVLQEKGLVAMVADRDFTNSGHVIEFLGRKASIPKGAAMFSLRLGVPIVAAFVVREPGGRYRVLIEEPIYPTEAQKLPSKEEQVHALMRTYLKRIEDMIHAYPTQWLMFREFAVK